MARGFDKLPAKPLTCLAMKPIPAHLQPLVGQPSSQIDTPALVIDLDAMERNIARMATFARQHGVLWRPHAKLHKSAQIALWLEQAGAVGHCVQKLSEAEALARGSEPRASERGRPPLGTTPNLADRAASQVSRQTRVCRCA